jgi:hypothetical protein
VLHAQRSRQELQRISALTATIDELAQMLAGMAGERFAARAADVRDVGRRLLRPCSGRSVRLDRCRRRYRGLTSRPATASPIRAARASVAAAGARPPIAILARTLGFRPWWARPAALGSIAPASNWR